MSRAVDRDRPMPGDSPPDAGPLGVSSIVIAASGRLAPAAHGPSPRPPPGRRAGGRHRDPAVPAGAPGGRARHRRPRARLRGHGLRVPGDVAVPARRARARRAARLRRPPRRARAGGGRRARVRPARPRRSCSARCWPPGRSPTTAPDWWAGVPVGLACAALGFFAARSLFTRVRRRLDAEAAGRAAGLRRGRRARRRRREHPLPAARGAGRRRAGVAARRGRGAARARSTRACGSSAERRGAEEARPRRRRRDEARHARAGGGGGAGAHARPADRARPPRGRVRGRLPVGDAGLRRLDRHGHGARTATSSRR